MQPAGIVAGAVTDNGVVVGLVSDAVNDIGKLELAVDLDRFVPGEVVLVRLRRLLPARIVWRRTGFEVRQRVDEALATGVDRQLGLVDVAELFRARVHVYHALARTGNID